MHYVFESTKRHPKGRLAEFKKRLSPLGLPEDWEAEPYKVWMLRFDGFVLHYATTTGSYWCQADTPDVADELLEIVRACVEAPIVTERRVAAERLPHDDEEAPWISRSSTTPLAESAAT